MSTYDAATVAGWVKQMYSTQPKQRGALVASFAAAVGKVPATVYAWLAREGYVTGRKDRADKGRTKAPEDGLRMLAGMQMESAKKNTGKQVHPLREAVQISIANGWMPRISDGHVGRLLALRNLHPTQLRQPSVHRPLKSLHPNHVWQGDASVCVIYYLSNGQLKVMRQEEFNKNKPKNLQRVVAERVIRYVWEDHYSSALFVHYTLGSEDAQNLIDSFIAAVSRRDGEPFCGVPYMVMLDPGAANTSGLAVNLFRRLQCKLQVNTPGVPRAKGGVESAQNIVERRFEGRLRFTRVVDIDDMNRLVRKWLLKFNGAEIHTRHGKTRNAVWLTWRGEQLREAPSAQMLMALVATKPVVRQVEGDRSIQFGGRRYRLDDIPDAYRGCRVEVTVNPYESPSVRVCLLPPNWNGVSLLESPDTTTYTVAPVARDAAGFDVDAVVIGEAYRAPKDSPADTNRKALTIEAYGGATLEEALKRRRQKGLPYEGKVNIFADVDAYEPLTYLPRRGVDMAVSGATTDRMLSKSEACKWLKAELGPDYGGHVYQAVHHEFGDGGVPESLLPRLREQFGRAPNERSLTDERPALRVVGGSE